jgi:serine/threonine protein kinase
MLFKTPNGKQIELRVESF